MNTHRFLPLVLALSASLLAPACLIGSSSKTDHTGRYISEQTLREIEPGASKDFVLEVCGEPTTRIDAADGSELWKWEYRQETNRSGGVFLLVGSNSSTKSESAVWVKFTGDQVVRVWRDTPPSG